MMFKFYSSVKLWAMVVAFCCFLISAPYAEGQPIRVSVPDTMASASDTLFLPVNILDSVTGLEIYGGGFTLTFDDVVLVSIGTVTAGPVAQGFTVIANTEVPGEVTVALFSLNDPMSGSGVLAVIPFHVVGGPGDTTTLHFTSMQLAEDTVPTAPEDGLFTVYLPEPMVPVIEVTPSSLDFGDVPVATDSNLPLTIRNSGTADLMISDIGFSNPDVFTTNFDPVDNLIAPGDSLEVTVTFHPTQAIPYTDNLTILNNDETVQVPLSGAGFTPTVTLSLPDTTVRSGVQVAVTLDVRSVKENGFNGASGIIIVFDPNVVTVATQDGYPLIVSALPEVLSPVFQKNVVADSIFIAIALSDGVTYSGPIAEITFDVIGDPGDESPLDLVSGSVVVDNDPTEGNDPELVPTNLVDGRIAVPRFYEISGSVVYYSDPARAVPNVHLNLEGISQPDVDSVATSDASGAYVFPEVLAEEDHRITPSKDADVRDAVNILDAIAILRFEVRLDPPPTAGSAQFIASDVNADDVCDILDAIKILRLEVHLEALPFDNVGAYWTFVPERREYLDLDSDRSGENYIGILYGDVNGNWGESTAKRAEGGYDVRLSLETAREEAGGRLIVPLRIADARQILGVSLTVRYPSDDLALQEVRTTEQTEDYLLVVNGESPGELRFAMAGVRPLEGQANVAELIFNLVDRDLGIPSLEITESRIFDMGGSVHVKIGESGLGRIPGRASLQQNYPNPFNARTAIDFTVPDGVSLTRVHLRIYDTLGQLVKTLVEEEMRPGYHSVQWDGKDQRGENLATGLYLYRIKVGVFVSVKKMVLLR